MQILLILLLIGMSISWTVSYVQMFRWSHGNTVALKKGEPLPKLDFKRIIKCKKHILLSDVILILGVVALAFLSSVKAQITFMLSLDRFNELPKVDMIIVVPSVPVNVVFQAVTSVFMDAMVFVGIETVSPSKKK